MSKRISFVLIILLLVFNSLSGQILDIKIVNIRNCVGQICIAVFANQADFKNEKTIYALYCCKETIKHGQLEAFINVLPGVYGVSVLDDNNFDGKMDYNLFGIPQEGFGFSNYFHQGILKPAFDDFKFDIQKNETKKLYVKMKYF